MDINTRNRTELKSYFRKNDIPTESQFAELIDGMLNQKEDGIVKLPNSPLSIEAAGDANSEKKVLNFYSAFSAKNPDWSLSLNPGSEVDPKTRRPGLSINDGNGTSRLFVDQKSGFVGIGTTEPNTGRVEISSGWGNWLFLKQQRATEGGGGFVIHNPWRDTDNAQRNALIIGYQSSAGTVDWGKTVTIHGPTGYVGIGNAPAECLDVNGRIKAGALTIGLWPASPSYVFFGTNTLSQAESINYAVLQETTVGPAPGRTFINSPVDIRFRIKNVDRMIVEDKGVTINSNSTLSFMDTTRQMINLWSTVYGIGVQSWTQYFRSDRNFAWYLRGAHDNNELNPGANGTKLMHLNNNGDLHITGSIYVNGDAFKKEAGAWKQIPKIFIPPIGGVVFNSDIRLKKNVEQIQNASDKLLSLRGVNYEWKEPERHGNLTGTQIGLIAQEVEKIFPDWVSTDAEGYKTLTISGFEGLVVEAFRVLNEQVEQLNAKIETLENK